MGFNVPYVDFNRQYKEIEAEIIDAVRNIFASGSFILRDAVSAFEERMADYLEVSHVVGVNSGTDAIFLSLAALNIGKYDEVITVSHTFVGTVSPIVHCGADVVFSDVDKDYNMDCSSLEKLITPKTRAIIPVHLNGRCCCMNEIVAFAKKYGIFVIEDAAQAIGASYSGKKAGSFGDTGCFSLHPMKNLGCAGDGGFIATDDYNIYKKLCLLRDHGQETKSRLLCFGFNSRLDTIQAAVLNVKMNYLNRWNNRRRQIAAFYEEGLKDVSEIFLPPSPTNRGDYYDVYSSYVVCAEERDNLYSYMRKEGIEVFIAWPVPLHKQEGLKLRSVSLPVTENFSKRVLSLPIAPELKDEQIVAVINVIRDFYGYDFTGEAYI